MLGRLTDAAFRRDAPRQPGSPPPGRPDRFPLFDSLRAIAALSIVVYHLGAPVDFGFATDAVLHLEVGVTIFFVISGFLLYRPFVKRRIDAEPPVDAGAYAWRRFLRIVPAYWVALTAISLWLGRDEVLGGHAATYYLFGQIYDPDTILRGIGQAWSLCVEMSFYIALPLWAALMRSLPARSRRARVQNEWIGLAVLVAVSYWYKEAVVLSHGPQVALSPGAGAVALPRYLDWFAVGMGLAVGSVAWQGESLPRALRPLDRFPAIGPALGAAAFAAVVALTNVHSSEGIHSVPASQLVGQHYLYALVGLCVVAPAVFGDQRRGVVRRILANRVLLWIGLVSYAVFLWHKAVIEQLVRWGTPTAVADATGLPEALVWPVLVLVPTLAIAWASWVLVERPLLELKRAVPWRGRTLGPASRLAGACAFVVLLCALSSGGFGAREAVLAVGASLVLACLTRPVRRRLGARGVPWAEAMLALGLILSVVAALRLASSSAGAASGDQGGARAYLVATQDGGRIRLYVDGVEAGSSSARGRVDPGKGPVEIGAFIGGSGWDGEIDEVAIYGRPLTGTEIARHWRSGNAAGGRYATLVSGTPGVVRYWRLDERSGRAARDLAGGATGTYGPSVRHGARGLLRGDSDAAAHFDGLGSHVLAPAPRADQLARGLSVEAWVRPDVLGNRHVAGRAGSWFLKADDGGHWRAGVTVDGRLHEAASGARIGGSGTPRPGPGAALIALAAALGIAVGGARATRGRRAAAHA